MIKSKIFDLKFNKNLTKHDIEMFFREKNIKPVKWAVVGISGDTAKVLVSY